MMSLQVVSKQNAWCFRTGNIAKIHECLDDVLHLPVFQRFSGVAAQASAGFYWFEDGVYESGIDGFN